MERSSRSNGNRAEASVPLPIGFSMLELKRIIAAKQIEVQWPNLLISHLWFLANGFRPSPNGNHKYENLPKILS
jgi:hypothetical protein